MPWQPQTLLQMYNNNLFITQTNLDKERELDPLLRIQRALLSNCLKLQARIASFPLPLLHTLESNLGLSGLLSPLLLLKQFKKRQSQLSQKQSLQRYLMYLEKNKKEACKQSQKFSLKEDPPLKSTFIHTRSLPSSAQLKSQRLSLAHQRAYAHKLKQIQQEEELQKSSWDKLQKPNSAALRKRHILQKKSKKLKKLHQQQAAKYKAWIKNNAKLPFVRAKSPSSPRHSLPKHVVHKFSPCQRSHKSQSKVQLYEAQRERERVQRMNVTHMAKKSYDKENKERRDQQEATRISFLIDRIAHKIQPLNNSYHFKQAPHKFKRISTSNKQYIKHSSLTHLAVTPTRIVNHQVRKRKIAIRAQHQLAVSRYLKKEEQYKERRLQAQQQLERQRRRQWELRIWRKLQMEQIEKVGFLS